MATQTKPASLESLPNEIKVAILSHLPDAKSAIALGLTGPAFYSVLSNNQGKIARDLAGKILDERDPAPLKLAFMAVESRLIDTRSVTEIKRFLDTFAHRGEWPSSLYRIRAVLAMPDLFAAAGRLTDWLCANAIAWPVTPTPRTFSTMEIARQRWACYALETGFNLLEFVDGSKFNSFCEKDHRGDVLPNRGHDTFFELARQFWTTFSKEEAYSFFCLLYMLDRWNNYDTINENPALARLRDTLGFMRIYGDDGAAFRHGASIRISIIRSFDEGAFEEGSQRVPYVERTLRELPPFFDDPTRFLTPDRYYWVKWVSDCYMKRGIWHQVHHWLPTIGDKDRWEAVIRQGPGWAKVYTKAQRDKLGLGTD